MATTAAAHLFTAQPFSRPGNLRGQRHSSSIGRGGLSAAQPQQRQRLSPPTALPDDLVAECTSEAPGYNVRPIADIAAQACCSGPQPQADTAVAAAPLPVALALLGGALVAGYGIKKVFDTPSRSYDQNVGQEYDAWTEEGVLEYYWGEHIHLGYYTDEVGPMCTPLACPPASCTSHLPSQYISCI